MKIEKSQLRELIAISHDMKEMAYCPYSHFPVGAALLCEDGSIITGCNVENAVYPLGVCAEKTAIVKAISEGHRKFKAIVISSNLKDRVIVPCGNCRQTLAEYGMDWDVYMTKPDGSYLNMKIRELLPLAFCPDQLEEERLPETHSTHSSDEDISGRVRRISERLKNSTLTDSNGCTNVIPVAGGRNLAAKVDKYETAMTPPKH